MPWRNEYLWSVLCCVMQFGGIRAMLCWGFEHICHVSFGPRRSLVRPVSEVIVARDADTTCTADNSYCAENGAPDLPPCKCLPESVLVNASFTLRSYFYIFLTERLKHISLQNILCQTDLISQSGSTRLHKLFIHKEMHATE